MLTFAVFIPATGKETDDFRPGKVGMKVHRHHGNGARVQAEWLRFGAFAARRARVVVTLDQRQGVPSNAGWERQHSIVMCIRETDTPPRSYRKTNKTGLAYHATTRLLSTAI